MAFVVSAADITALYTGIELQIRDAYFRYTPQLRGLAIEINSNQVQEAYPVQAINATLERWNGNRDATNYLQKVQYIVNGKPWQRKIAISRQDVELKGRTLDMSTVSALMGKAAKAKYDELIASLLQNGAATTCIDGTAFFNTTHPIVPWDVSYGTYTNLRTSFALNRANFRTAYQAMRALKGWDRQPFEVDHFCLLVPPQLESIGQEIVVTNFAANDGTQAGTSVASNNVDMGKAQLIVSQKLANEPAVWYLLSVIKPPSGKIDTSAEWGKGGPLAGPFAVQKWRELEIVPRFDLTSENVFERDEYEIGLSLGLEAGYLLPEHAVRCEG